MIGDWQFFVSFLDAQSSWRFFDRDLLSDLGGGVYVMFFVRPIDVR